MLRSHSVPSSPTCSFDDHEIEISVLQARLQTDICTGLSNELASKRQSDEGANILPTDVESGHGAIHELVAVLRDGGWIHTRAENLVRGDVIALKQGHSIPADSRVFQSEDLWVDNSCLTGKLRPEQRTASNLSVFEDNAFRVPYMESPNIVFYGTKIVRGSAKAIVLRTGAKTVLGVISKMIMSTNKNTNTINDDKLLDELRCFGVCLKGPGIPAEMKTVSTIVCQHTSTLSRTVVTVTFGSNLPAVVKSELGMEASETEIESDLATQMMDKYQQNDAANAFMRAMAACCALEPPSNYLDLNDGEEEQNSVDAQKRATLRFCAYFGVSSPSVGHRKKRCSSFLCGVVSGCEVYVHFDEACGAHVVLLEGPAREILSRCGKVSRHGKIDTLETADLREVDLLITELEKSGQTMIGFAELYLDPSRYPVGYNFDIEQLNFPTANMCYLGALGVIDRLHPDVIQMVRNAEAADLRLIITTDTPWQCKMNDEIHEKYKCNVSRSIPLKLNELETDKPFQADCQVLSSEVISITNTLTEWKDILLKYERVIICGCTPAQVDIIVETLQDLEECVGYIASGNASALTMKKANIGFALPSNSAIDLCEEAADVVLGFSDSPRCDAIRMIRLVKQRLSAGTVLSVENDYTKIEEIEQPCNTTSHVVIRELFKQVALAAQCMHLSEEDIRECAKTALDSALGAPPTSASVGNIFSSMLGAFAHSTS